MTIKKDKVDLALANRIMTRRELAESSGLTYNGLTQILYIGKTSPATVGKIAKALNVPVESIM